VANTDWLKVYVREPRQLLKHQFVKFLLVGVINTIFGYLVFALSIYGGVHYSIAIIISNIAGTLFNFKTTGVLVFESHDNGLISKFFGVYIIIYFLNLAGLVTLHHAVVSRYIEQAILALPLALVSFYLNRRFVFNSPRAHDLIEKKVH
jgi:putative flippase GtrA